MTACLWPPPRPGVQAVGIGALAVGNIKYQCEKGLLLKP